MEQTEKETEFEKLLTSTQLRVMKTSTDYRTRGWQKGQGGLRKMTYASIVRCYGKGDWLIKRENTKVTKSLTRYKDSRYIQAPEGNEKKVFEKRRPEVEAS